MPTPVKFLPLLPLAFLLLSVPHAQQRQGTRVAFVDVTKVVAAAPGGASYASLRKEADTKLAQQLKRIQALQQRVAGGTASAKDRQDLQTATRTYTTSVQNYQKQLQQRLAPVANTVNATIKSVASAQGFAVVLDAGVAKSSNLVVYADSRTTDLTQAVVNRLKR